MICTCVCDSRIHYSAGTYSVPVSTGWYEYDYYICPFCMSTWHGDTGDHCVLVSDDYVEVDGINESEINQDSNPEQNIIEGKKQNLFL